MTLGELQQTVNSLIDRGHDLNDEVRITTSNDSVGARASVGVQYVCPGFDFEKGQILITTDKKIVSENEE